MNTPAAHDNQASITAISALRDHFRTLTTSMSPIAGGAGTDKEDCAIELIVSERGSFVGKHQGRLRVTNDNGEKREVPIMHLRQVIICGGGIAISSDAVRACSEEGIPLHFISANGTPHASLYSAGLNGTVLARRAQLRAYDGPAGVALARAFTLGKLGNQANLLRYAAKNRKETAPEVYEQLMAVAGEVVDYQIAVERLRGETVDEIREALMGIEGRYAARYWQAIGLLVPAELNWPGRETRGASDPFNQALNYGYGVLYGQVEHAHRLSRTRPVCRSLACRPAGQTESGARSDRRIPPSGG